MSRITSADPFQTLEALRTFEKRHKERDITARVYVFTHGGNDYAMSSNGWSILAVRTHMISSVAANGLKSLPDNYVPQFRSYFTPTTSAQEMKIKLKELRQWCGAPKFRRCPQCEQSLNVVRHGGNLFDRAIDRNLIAMAIAFGDEDAPIVLSPHSPGHLAPIVFRHEHFLAVVMPMRESLEGMPIYPEQGV